MTVFSNDIELQRFNRTPDNGEEKLVILGTGQGRDIGDLYARLPTGPNQPPSQYLWARDIGSVMPFEIIGGGSVTIGHDVQVWVEWLSSENMWRLKRADLNYLSTIKRSVHFDNPNDAHNQNHRLEQLLPLRSFPVGGLKLAVAGVRFTDKQGRNVDWKGTSNEAGGHAHIDLTSYRPATTGHKCFALVYFDVEEYHDGNHPIGVVVSTSQATALDGTDIQQCLNQLNALGTEYLESLAVRLDNGLTNWRGHGDDQDRRPWLTGNGGNPTITITSEDESVTIVEDPAGTFDLSVTSSGGITQLTGDGTAGPGSGSQVFTLTTVNSNPGTTAYPSSISSDGKGRITAITAGTAPVTSVAETTNYLSVNNIGGAVTLSPTASQTPALVVATHPTTPSVAELRSLDPEHIPFLDAAKITSGTFPINIPIDMLNQTAGENWSARDNLYLNPSTGTWFKADNDAIAMGVMRGVATASATSGTTNNRIRCLGLLTGYSSLTANAPIYASSTAGGLTQTEPAPTLDGSTLAIAMYGYALTTTSVWIDTRTPVIYRQYVTSSAGETTTITHHANVPSQSRTFSARTYVYDEVSIETYASSNQDANKQLKGQSGAGSTTTVDTAGAATFVLGDSGGTDFQVAQSFTVTAAGKATSMTVQAGATTGTPSGFPILEICLDSGGNPGAVIATQALVAWTASGSNAITITDEPFLSTATTYWAKLRLGAMQATNNFYTVVRNSANPYASGVMKADSTTGASFPGTWGALAAGSDLRMAITMTAVTLYDRIAQGFSHSSGATLLSVKLWLRKVASATGNLKLSIFSDTSSLPNTLITNGDSDVIDASTLGTSYAWVTFTFSTPPSISASTPYHMVLSTTGSASNTNYVEWGIDASSPSYANGVLTSDTGGTWSTATPAADAIFDVIAQGTQSEEDLSLGQYTGGTGQYGVRRGSSTGTNPSTQTTFKNISGESMPIVYDVYVP